MKPTIVSAQVTLSPKLKARCSSAALSPTSFNFNITEIGKAATANTRLLSATENLPSEKMDEIATLVKQMAAYDAPMMEWLSQDPRHIQQYFDNPLEGFKTATNAPETIIKQLQEIASKYPHFLPISPEEQKVQVPPPASRKSLQSNETYIDYSQGWDMVGAIYQKEANKGLILAYNNKLLPTNFNQSFDYKLGIIVIKINIQGLFDAPQIIGGTGEIVSLKLKLKTGFAEYSVAGMYEQPQNGKITLDGVVINFSTNLKHIQSTGKQPGGKKYEYYINCTDADAFCSLKFENLPSEPVCPDFVRTMIEQELMKILRSTSVGKEYKLFEVELGCIDTKFPYLVPKYIRYAFIENGNSKPDDNILGVLIQTTGTEGSSIQLLNGTIPSKSRATVILGNRLFTENILMDIVCEAFDETHTTFKTEGSPQILTNTHSFKYKKPIQGYSVEIQNFKTWLGDNSLHLDLTAEIIPSSGIHVTYFINSSYKAIITRSEEDGKKIQVIKFEKSTYTENHAVTAEWWVWLIAFLSLGVGALVLKVILGIIECILPTIGPDVFTGALGEIKWNYIDIIEINEIYLNGPVQIGGAVKLLE